MRLFLSTGGFPGRLHRLILVEVGFSFLQSLLRLLVVCLNLLLPITFGLLSLLVLAHLVKVLPLGVRFLLLLESILLHFLLKVDPLLLLDLGHARLKHLLQHIFVLFGLFVKALFFFSEGLGLLFDQLRDLLRLL